MLEQLIKIGLSENEAKVYLALLELGSGTAQQIAQKANVGRPTTYVQLENLMKIGLVSSFEKETTSGTEKTLFRAEDPEHLKNVVEKINRAAKARKDALSKALPELGNLFAAKGERPRVRFFEGMGGIKAIQNEFLKTANKLIEGITSWDDVLQLLPAHQKTYRPKRIKKGIKTRMIYTSSRGSILKKEDATALRESYLVPADAFPIKADVAVSGNMVSLVVFKEKPFGIIIENKHIAETMRSLLRLAVESAKKYSN